MIEEPPPADTGDVLAAFGAGELPLCKADQITRFTEQVARVADPSLLAVTLGAILRSAKDDVLVGSGEVPPDRVRGLSEKQLRTAIDLAARLLRPERDIEDDDNRARAGRALYKIAGPIGLTAYKLVLDPEGAAIIDAVIAALGKPCPDDDGPDPRSAPQRHADALLQVVQRGVSAPGEAPTTDKAQVVVTVPLAALATALESEAGLPWASPSPSVRPTHCAGVTGTGQVLAPSVVRRMACDAAILPMVLGRSGEALDLGRRSRLFTAGQRIAVWERDQHCTYPGCTMPVSWCDLHHVTWWSRGGRTDLTNAAALCRRHHTRVHQLDLTATITATGVTWHV